MANTYAEIFSPDTLRGKEAAKFNKPYRYEHYPKMLYKAQFNPVAMKHEVMIYRDVLSPDRTITVLSMEQFNASCQFTVNNEQEHERAKSEGWRDTPREATAFYEGLQNDIARAAAERAYADRKMSETAKAEAEKAEASTHEQVPEIPESRKRKAS